MTTGYPARPDDTRADLDGPPAPAPAPKRGRWVGGAVFAGLALVALLLPWLTIGGVPYSVTQAHDLCHSGLGQFAQALSGQVAASCGQIDTAYVLCWAAVAAGVGLGIAGAVRGHRDAGK